MSLNFHLCFVTFHMLLINHYEVSLKLKSDNTCMCLDVEPSDNQLVEIVVKVTQ